MSIAKYPLLFAALLPALARGQHPVEEVTVVGTLREQSTAELAQSVTVLRDDELDRVRASNLGETLEGELGMSASFFGAGASRPIIRGLAGARVRTLEDGIDSMDVSTVSADHAVGIDPLVAQQIEIFRGPTSLLYGSGAVGGVINTVTNRIPESIPAGGLAAGFEFRADTAAAERTAVVALDGGKESLAWHFDGATRDTDDYEIPGFASQNHDPTTNSGAVAGELLNSGLELSSFALGGSWLGDSASFGASISGFDTVYGVPVRPEDQVAALPCACRPRNRSDRR